VVVVAIVLVCLENACGKALFSFVCMEPLVEVEVERAESSRVR
jgi:hypothetical protein